MAVQKSTCSMRIRPLNTVNGICRTMLSTYYKIGVYNVFEHQFPAVLTIYED